MHLEPRQLPPFLARLVFHLLPVVPLAYGRGFGVVAAVLFVALPYIKVMKLRGDLAQLEATAGTSPPPRAAKEITGLTVAVRRWQAVTFLTWFENRREAR